ncbi:MAG: D-alanine--D-alanine ligase [Planctomycetota bacterium]
MSRKILFLAGSPSDAFHAELSRVYATDCLEALAGVAGDDWTVAWFSPDRTVCFPSRLQPSEISRARRYSLVQACQHIVASKFDVAVPQMFCPAGMTDYRSLLETLGVPVVGNTAVTMANTMDKATARAIATAAGIPMPRGKAVEQLDPGDHELPVVIKPARADNSQGVSLVRRADELCKAFEIAKQYDDKVIVEQFIPLGREVRCATLYRGGKIECLPLQEYCLDASAVPIRDEASKLLRTPDGSIDLTSKHHPTSSIVDVDDPVTKAVWTVARQCHQAFGCRDYGLFDFRIDPEGQPYFLEAGLYCSFAPKSIVVAVAEAAGISLPELFDHCIDMAIQRRSPALPNTNRFEGPHSVTGETPGVAVST